MKALVRGLCVGIFLESSGFSAMDLSWWVACVSLNVALVFTGE